MDKFWTAAVKATGPVAVVGFILWYCLQQFFSVEILALFSSQQRFALTLGAVGSLVVVLWAAVRAHYSKVEKASSPTANTANISNSSISGDFVMGNKVGKSDTDK